MASAIVNVIYLHHSTGNCIWNGGIEACIREHNKAHNTDIRIREQAFPRDKPYGWANYPYDYYNIWVKNGGTKPFKDEPTLEMLTKEYNVIVFKHCFPVGYVEEDGGKGDIDSPKKTPATYRLQYEALKKKMRGFPKTKFIVWTGAALVQKATSEGNAKRAREFFDWVKDSWDEKGDNIFVWDFNELQTEGGLYFKDAYAVGEKDSHPNETFSRAAAPLFCRRLISVIDGTGDSTSLTGK